MKIIQTLILWSPLAGIIAAGFLLPEETLQKVPGGTQVSSLLDRASNRVERTATNSSEWIKSEEKKIYSWRDAQGHMQFSETAPPDGTAGVQLSAAPQAINTIPALEIPLKSESAADTGGAPSPGFNLPLTTIPISDIPKLIEDAKGLQDLADQRNAVLEDIR